jgi:membrane fusion protein, multidrug efflux system
MKARGAVLALAGLAGLAPLFAACGARREAASPARAPSPVAVRTARIGGAQAGVAQVPGTVEAVESAAIASRVAATVTSVTAEIGQSVRQGALLARLDARDLAARVAGAEAGLHAADAQLARLRDLLGRDAATRQEVEAAEAAAAAARAERDAAQAQIAYAELRAPFDGVVVDRRVRAGDLATPGETLFIVQGQGRLRVSASVSRSQADALKEGQEIPVVREDGSTIAARLSIVSPASDPGSRRVLVKADLPRDAGLRAGAFVRLRLPAGDEAAPALVPRAAIVERGALTGVFVVEEGRARLRWISPGASAGDAVEARAGVAPGEVVVIDPAGLVDGAPVTTAAAGHSATPEDAAPPVAAPGTPPR